MSSEYPQHLATFLEIEIMRQLFRQLAQRCPGGRMPDKYVVVDSETTGTDTSAARVLQWGYCLIKDRKLIDSASFYVKRGKETEIPAGAAAVHGITHELLAKEGEDPKESITAFVDLLNHFRREGFMFAGHNLLAFDARLLERETAVFGLKFEFGPDEVLDTGMLVKASQLGITMYPEDTLRKFYERVSARRAGGVYWSLARHCIKEYRLNRFVDQKTIDNAHDAKVDCILTHHLFEVMRDTVFGGPREIKTEVARA